jgi:hypothetical protein
MFIVHAEVANDEAGAQPRTHGAQGVSGERRYVVRVRPA